MTSTEHEIISERNDEVFVYNVLPDFCTKNTSIDYFRKFPYFNEEIYYLLEYASLENADVEDVIKTCQDIVYKRNKELIEKIENGRKPNEIEISTEMFDYYVAQYNEIFSSINGECATSIPTINICNEEK